MQISLAAATGTASFVRLKPDAPGAGMAKSQSPDQKTRSFLARHESVFGLDNHLEELVLKSQSVDTYRNGHTRYRQVYKGLPVFGAELSSHFDRNGLLQAISSSVIDIDGLDTTPSVSRPDAESIAKGHVMRSLKSGAPRDEPQSINSELLVFRTGLLQGVKGANHLAYRVEVADDIRSIREFVFVDAHSGEALDQITGIHKALDRKVSEVYFETIKWQDSSGDPDPITTGWAGGSALQITEWQNEIDASREIYNLIASITAGSWLSYDGADATMRTVHNSVGLSCPNASWNGVSTNYCDDVTSDDVVAHEWGHAYTQYSANLIYQWQAGALNEHYSDVWGEVVDLINDRGTDSPGALRTDGGCTVYTNSLNAVDENYRWLIGEDSTAFGLPIRDMWSPTCRGAPGKVSDSYYWCSTGDYGGVHFNSGVPNHAFALLVDGGNYNGRVINGIGLTKASHIYWNSLFMLTPASNFAGQADALEASCEALTGIDLPALSTEQTNAGLSGAKIDSQDCAQLEAAINAVELRSIPLQCNFESILETNPPPLCEGKDVVDSISLTDWENGLGSWTAVTHDVVNQNTFAIPDWQVVAGLPGERPGSAAFVADPVTGNCEDDDQSGVLSLDSPPILIPEDYPITRVAINHWMASELEYDGGNLKISVNGGPYFLIPAAKFEVGPYNDELIIGSGLSFSTNPLAGEPAFTGTDQGTFAGSWGQSQVNLDGIARAGDTIRLRFDFGLDGCNGVIGWYVDEVEVYACSSESAWPDCGNGTRDAGETCDDANRSAEDGCSNSCQVEPGWYCSLTPSICEELTAGHIFRDSFED